MKREIVNSEEYRRLIEECEALLSERRFDLVVRDLEWRWELGKILYTNKLLITERTEKGEILNRIAKDLGVSVGILYHCIKFYEVYPGEKLDIMKLPSKNKKILNWTEIRKTLFLKYEGECQHAETETEIIQINRVRCKKCGKIVGEEKGVLHQ